MTENEGVLTVNDETEESDIVNKSVVKAEKPIECLEEFERSAQAFYYREGTRFKTYEDCEYFHMLPLTKTQKSDLLDKISTTK